MDIGLFVDAPSLSIPSGTDRVHTSGWNEVGIGAATYLHDAAVDSSYVTTHDRSSFMTTNGRGFRIDERQPLTIEMFGGKADWDGSAGTDNQLALEAVLDLATFSSTGSATYAVAPDIHFGIGKYHFATTVELKTIVRIWGIGSGADNRGNGTNWYFPADTAGIIVHQSNTFGSTGGAVTPTTSGQGSVIDGITLRGSGTDGGKHGIQLRARAVIRNCSIYSFPGDGVHIEASAGSGSMEGNANGWFFQNGFIQEVLGHFFFVKGTDTNAGTCIKLETKGNAGIGRCGVLDQSGLGNNYFGLNLGGYGNSGVHKDGIRYVLISSAAGIGAATTPGTNNNIWYEYAAGGPTATFPEWSGSGSYDLASPIMAFGASNRSIFEGIYVEGGHPCHIEAPAIAFGGQVVFTRRSAHVHLGTTLSPMLCRTGVGGRRDYLAGTPGYGANAAYAWSAVGSAPAGDEDGHCVLEHRRQIDGDFSYEYKYSGGEIVYAMLNQKALWRISTPTTAASFGRPLSAVPHMITFTDYAVRDPSNSNNWRIHGIKNSIPSAAGEYARGEVRWNAAFSGANAPLWGCTVGGALASAWVSGTNYDLGNYILSSGGRYYKLTAKDESASSSINEPTHTSGDVSEADGFTWTHVTATAAVWTPIAVPQTMGTSTANANITLTPYVSAPRLLHTGTLTADRTITLSTTGAIDGQTTFRVTRTGGGTFNLSIGGLKNLVQNSWCEVTYVGGTWRLTASGTL